MQRITSYRRAPVVQKALNLLECQVRECDCLDSPDAVRDYLQRYRTQQQSAPK